MENDSVYFGKENSHNANLHVEKCSLINYKYEILPASSHDILLLKPAYTIRSLVHVMQPYHK